VARLTVAGRLDSTFGRLTLRVAAETCGHRHEVLVGVVRLLGLGIRENHLEVLFVRNPVVADRAGDLCLLMRLVVDEYAARWCDRALVEIVALSALPRCHSESEFALTVQWQLEVVGECEIELAQGLGLVQHEGDRAGPNRHVAGHTADLGMRRTLICLDGVVLDLVTALGTEPASRSDAQSRKQDRRSHKYRHERPQNVSWPPNGVLEAC
jgi:hypothetical protein